MIYYFSGTGNSKAIALRLAAACQEEAVCITSATHHNRKDQVLGFVFPVYAWGLPRVMLQFIHELKIAQLPQYTFMVCTCGDDIGYTHKEMRQQLLQKGITLQAAWSVKMPNTYVSLPGFDIDPQALIREKLAAAFPRVDHIAKLIESRKQGIVDVTPGPFPFIKSKILRPLFNTLLIGDRYFKVNDSCISCGRCVSVCPTQNIVLGKDKKPQWKGNCADCLSCYHNCPKHSISFGPFTRNKGQYILNKFIKEL